MSPCGSPSTPWPVTAYGYCAELLPEAISLDEWGYPIVDDRPLPAEFMALAKRAVRDCPKRAITVRETKNRSATASTTLDTASVTLGEWRRYRSDGQDPPSRLLPFRALTAWVTGGDMHNHTRHRNVQGGASRAAVLGAGDGLITNVSLILGVAGATTAASPVRLAGVAGLLAGAFSMAAGELVSVRAQDELVRTRTSGRAPGAHRAPQC